MQQLETYWGIQLLDGYVPISVDEAKRLLELDTLDALDGWILVTSLIGTKRLINFKHVLEIFESTPESRDHNREIDRLIDIEKSTWEKSNPTYDD